MTATRSSVAKRGIDPQRDPQLNKSTALSAHDAMANVSAAPGAKTVEGGTIPPHGLPELA